jgi:large subunit ribosomal protein L30
VADKGTKAIRIKWVRSGIGFPLRQKEIVRSLGLRKLNQVVERPDTPQIRGIVVKVPHLLRVVEREATAAWTTIPEYTVRPPEVVPQEEKVTTALEGQPAGAEVAVGESVPPTAVAGEPAVAEEPERAAPAEVPAAAKEVHAKKGASRAGAKKEKPAKTADHKPKKGEKGTATGQKSKPAKARKK